MTTTRKILTVAAVPAMVAASTATWWAWLGWDTEYDIDPVTGSSSGPYQAWQVVGCVLTLVAIAVVGALLTRAWIPPILITLSFTLVWSAWASHTDDSGLWLVGAILLFFGLAVGSSLVSGVTWLVQRVSNSAASVAQ